MGMYICYKGGSATLDFGAYAIAMASHVFGEARPENIKANGYLSDTGVDELVSVTIKYAGTDEDCSYHAITYRRTQHTI